MSAANDVVTSDLSVYDMEFFINVLGNAFKMMKNAVYLIAKAFFVLGKLEDLWRHKIKEMM